MIYYVRNGRLLQDHLDKVSALIKLFSDKFRAGDIGSLVGLFHVKVCI